MVYKGRWYCEKGDTILQLGEVKVDYMDPDGCSAHKISLMQNRFLLKAIRIKQQLLKPKQAR